MCRILLLIVLGLAAAAAAQTEARPFEIAAWVDHYDFAAAQQDGKFLFDTETSQGIAAVLDHVQETGATTILWRNCAGSTMRYQSVEESHHNDSQLDKRRVLDDRAIFGWVRYGDPAGDPALRAAVSRRLADLGVPAEPWQIVTTVGATHALDIVARTLLQPGDAVLVDEPGWAVEYERLSRMGMRLLPVPRGADGPDLATMQALLLAHRPRLYVTVSVLHNPTGNTLTPAAAHQVLRLAEQHDLTIVEDDTYAFLAPPQATRLATLDGLKRTVLVSGFSKILTPQWRVGFVAAPPALAERFIDSKLISTLTTPAPLEQAIAWCLDQGLLRRHAERIQQRLDAARAHAVRHALAAGARFVTPPQGLFGWVDVGTDTERLALAMLDEGWLLAPGTLFQVGRRPSTCMRINFAATQDGRFWAALPALR
jgi:DNA-binding transcriptional MocR family regulator